MRKLFAFIIGVACAIAFGVAAHADDQRDYGEYLSGECTGCHRDADTDTIPSIIGYDQDSFVVIMNSYKAGERENKAMISVAQALDEEQIKALAVYFSSLKSKTQ